MAAAKLLTVKEFSEASLMPTMRSAWNTALEVTFRPIGKNIFVVQAFCLGDWKRIMEKGPWIFRGDFHRARVNLEASRPLLRFFTLAPERQDNILIQIKYEKIPQFCSHCDLMGHFGNWMIAGEKTWHPVTPRVRGNTGVEREQPKEERGAHPARGRGRGRGGWGSYPWGGVWMKKKVGSDDGLGLRKRASEEVGLDKGTDAELSDTATSPVKPMEEKHGRYGFPPPPKYISPREKKKQKKLIESEKEVPNTTMADFEKEDHREQ
uniref:Uncharacterized protein n=1 Tax=Setaria italica TaxID=4555 RepID=K3YLS0_SETIT